MKTLRYILYPLVPVYAVLMEIRNWFFDKKVFKSKKVNAKIISVGNITVGGSGKTPLVIYLSNLLKKEGRKVGVLSRGYGRKSKGYVLVSKGHQILTSVDLCGDEIYHTALECKIPAAVSENRVLGAKLLIKETGVDTIVLDDAFQHRWIERDANVLICEQRFLHNFSIMSQSLLPSGVMRESFSSIKRADAVIINRKFSGKMEIPDRLKKYFKGKKIFTAYYKAIEFVDIKKRTHYKIEEFEGQKSLVVSGVANPYSFVTALEQNNVDTQNRIIFKDHKDYATKEIQRIRKEFYETNSQSVVTTEKDAVKLSKYSKELDDIDIFFLKIELELDETERFREYLNNMFNLSY
ncbi:MAG: tetraacyldisaccharide 4'-kinase [Ignavibacteriaceae bacterium]|jgi:tetraacyldisaccharide 4'-kinase